MKFDRLNSSIVLNAKEPPSLYMALCMVESLFRDMEDATGADISQADPGDEQLPTKLIWLGRKLLKIYSENGERFQRNRSRLDDMMNKLRQQEQELEKVADEPAALSSLKARAADLDRRLAQAEADRAQTEDLRELCRQAEDRIRGLEGFDPNAAREELDRLSEREQALARQRSDLAEGLDRVKQSCTALAQECAGQEQTKQRLQRALESILQEKQAAAAVIAELDRTSGEAKQELEELTRKKDGMIEDRAFFEQQLVQLRQEIDNYQTEKLLPLQQEKARLSEEERKLESSLSELKKERDDAVFRIARINQQVAAAAQAQQTKQTELAGKQREADAAAAKIADLRRRTEAETDRLAALQQEGAELEQTRLPQLKSLLTEQEQHNRLLADNVSAMEQRKQTLAADQIRLQEEEAGLVQTLAELNQTHADLTASYDAKNEQLQELRKKVEELRGKNGREQERRYRQQLSEELAQLEEISNTCEDLERELETVKTACANKQAQADQLRRQKQAADDAERSINAVLQLLTPYANGKLQQRVQALQDRHKLLSETHERLEEAVNMMQTTLDIPPETLTSNPEGLSESLQMCGKALDKLQRALVRCANQIRTEIKLDVKMEEQ